MLRVALLIFGLLTAIGCSNGGNAIKILDATSEVYVVLSPTALLGGVPKSPSEVRQVERAKFADSIVFDYRDHALEGETRRVIVVYTAPQLLPDGSAYLTVTPNQALELASKDATAEGVLVNPESPANTGFLAKDKLGAALQSLSARKPMPRSLSIKMP